MEGDFLRKAANRAVDVYKPGHSVDHGVTRCSIDIKNICGQAYTVLTVKGTDRTLKDWKRNFNLTDIDGVKDHAANAVEVLETLGIKNMGLPVLVVCHSQGVEGLEFFRKHCDWEEPDGSDRCVCFGCPPIYRKKLKIKNVLMVVNNRDIVPYAGGLSFNHPVISPDGAESLWFDKNGKAYENISFTKMYWKQKMSFSWDMLQDKTEDHDIVAYRNNIISYVGP